MDGSSFAVRHSNTGKAADDLVVGIAEAQAELAATDTGNWRPFSATDGTSDVTPS